MIILYDNLNIFICWLHLALSLLARPVDTVAEPSDGQTAAAGQNGKLGHPDGRRHTTEEDNGDEDEQEPNFDDEFDGESLSNCSSWASGLSQDKTDRNRN